MKKRILMLTLTALLSLFVVPGFSQDPPPPPGSGHGQTGNQNGGNAPVGGGLFILLGLGAAYGSKKVYNLNKKELDD